MNVESVDRLFLRFRASRDPDALGDLVDALAPELARRARSAVGEAADDVVQATFLAMIEAAPRFDASRPVRPWVRGILYKLVAMEQRRTARRAGEAQLPGDAEAAERSAHRETSELVAAAIDDLPPTYRPIVLLALGRDMRPAEIAEVVGRPASRVRVQLHRGLSMLRKRLPAGLALPTVALTLWPRTLAGQRAFLSGVVARRSGRWVFSQGFPLGLVASVCGVLLLAASAWWVVERGFFFGAGAEAVADRVASAAQEEASRSEPRAGDAEKRGVSSEAPEALRPAATPPLVTVPFSEPPSTLASKFVRRVVDARGRPLPGVKVVLGLVFAPQQPPMPGVGTMRAQVAAAVSDASGRVEFAGVRERVAEVRKRLAAYPRKLTTRCVLHVDEIYPVEPLESFEVGRVPTDRRDLVVARDWGWLDVAIRHFDHIDAKKLQVTIQLGESHPRATRSHDKTVTGSTVSFLVPLGKRFAVSVTADGKTSEHLRVHDVPGPVVQGERRSIGFGLDGVRFAGKVVDRQGRSRAGVDIVVALFEEFGDRPFGEARARSGANGRFLTPPVDLRSLGPALVRIFARNGAGTLAVASRPRTITSPYFDVELENVVATKEPVIVAGVCVDGAGQPIEGARVFAHCVDGKGATHYDHVSTLSDAKGRFELRGACHGTVAGVRAVSPQYDRSARIQCIAGQAGVVIRIPRGAELRARLVVPRGKKPGDYRVDLHHPNSQCENALDGTFLGGPTGGSYLQKDRRMQQEEFARYEGTGIEVGSDGRFGWTNVYPGRVAVVVLTKEGRFVQVVPNVVLSAGEKRDLGDIVLR